MISLNELINKLQQLKEELVFEGKNPDLEFIGYGREEDTEYLKDISIDYYENHNGNVIEITKIYNQKL